MPRRDLIGLSGIVILLAWAYHAVGAYGAVYEDAMWLARANAPLTWDLLWRPSRLLTMGSYSLQLALGHSLGVIHLTNVGLHALNTMLLWRFATVLGWPAPLAVAGIFALHPLQVETVAYITSRGDELAVTGILLTLLWVVQSERWSLWRLGVAVGLSGLTLLAKESAVALVALLPLATWCGVIPKRKGWYLPTFIIAGLVIAAGGVQMASSVHTAAEGNVIRWFAVQSVMLWQVMLLVIWPVGLTVDHDPEGVRQILQLAALVGVQYWVFLGGRLRATDARLSFALLWIVLAVWPRLVIQTPESTLNEHQVHVSMIGVALLGAWLWDRGCRLSTYLYECWPDVVKRRLHPEMVTP